MSMLVFSAQRRYKQYGRATTLWALCVFVKDPLAFDLCVMCE